MKTRTGWMIAAVLALAVPAWAHCGFCDNDGKTQKKGHAHASAEIGKPAPAFSLKDADGAEHKLADLKGKIVVLEWINHECPVVNRCHNAKTMTNTLAKFKGKPVVWLAIDSSHFSLDKISNIRKWTDKQKLGYPYLLDADGKVGQLYGAKTTPHLFVIDKSGVLAYRGAVDDDPYGKNETKTNYVESAIDALLKGSTVAVATTKSYGCSVKYKQ